MPVEQEGEQDAQAREPQSVAVVASQDSPLVVALTDGQLKAVTDAVSSTGSVLTRKDVDTLLSAVGHGGSDAAALDSEQYSQLMGAVTANNVCLSVVVVLLLGVMGMLFSRALWGHWRSR